MYDFFNRGIEFRIGEFPVTLHWTIFLVLLDAIAYLAYPALLLLDLASFVLIILIHELGHAFFCWRRKYAVDICPLLGRGVRP